MATGEAQLLAQKYKESVISDLQTDIINVDLIRADRADYFVELGLDCVELVNSRVPFGSD